MAEEEYYDDYAEEQIDETYWQETDEQAQEEVVGYNEEAGGLGIEEEGYGGDSLTEIDFGRLRRRRKRVQVRLHGTTSVFGAIAAVV